MYFVAVLLFRLVICEWYQPGRTSSLDRSISALYRGKEWNVTFPGHGAFSPLGSDLVFDGRDGKNQFLLLYYDSATRTSRLRTLSLDGAWTSDIVLDYTTRDLFQQLESLLQVRGFVVYYDPKFDAFRAVDVDTGMLKGSIVPPVSGRFDYGPERRQSPSVAITQTGKDFYVGVFEDCRLVRADLVSSCFRVARYDLSTLRRTWLSNELFLCTTAYCGFSLSSDGSSLLFRSNVISSSSDQYQLNRLDTHRHTFSSVLTQSLLPYSAKLRASDPPLISQSRVFVTTNSDSSSSISLDHSSAFGLNSYDLETLSLLWSTSLASPSSTTLSSCGSPRVIDETIFVPCAFASDPEDAGFTVIRAFSSETGSPLWSTTLEDLSCRGLSTVVTTEGGEEGLSLSCHHSFSDQFVVMEDVVIEAESGKVVRREVVGRETEFCSHVPVGLDGAKVWCYLELVGESPRVSTCEASCRLIRF